MWEAVESLLPEQIAALERSVDLSGWTPASAKATPVLRVGVADPPLVAAASAPVFFVA